MFRYLLVQYSTIYNFYYTLFTWVNKQCPKIFFVRPPLISLSFLFYIKSIFFFRFYIDLKSNNISF
ncbi:hypothetical protein GLOIN_2v1694445 [Rhizophagus irregularis DAOM 181602=DAOM 197198]|uniref:Uncharacterized protein n=1 Tax=Rhizophagus irregularis (strain DAOM 181602 / DAOM 197198 / MUCL 43194) TaxID=747089 RepID=A0A2P4PB73_RHIID|nr:hypothetical protein GLOIN_2v1694445 [Rhizophagus irregularis DAOM 181602=DAOM 197198]POG62646.1 hypothetical protein GLOIN_2v1694445 [Rhizophagus irregularis DAOM 181602=DAOM 197198]|eukprot:XP_025169512.1 hypothetical protein GLOIN_2v1694445 [Rhizophagus irregularis DAOM 181602=DAOM 197198]